MKTNYFLKLEIELAELKKKLAYHRLDKHQALEDQKYDQAADTRKWEKEVKTRIRALVEAATYTFSYHIQNEDRNIFRPQFERFLADAKLALKSKTTKHINLEKETNLEEETNPIQAPNTEQAPNLAAQEAFHEHFSHIFTELSALHEKLMEEERFIDAKNVIDQCMSIAVYIQTWGEERW